MSFQAKGYCEYAEKNGGNRSAEREFDSLCEIGELNYSLYQSLGDLSKTTLA